MRAAATHQARDPLVGELQIALDLATRPTWTTAQTYHATRLVAAYCERAAYFAALALAERWELDATYAILRDATAPLLDLSARG